MAFGGGVSGGVNTSPGGAVPSTNPLPGLVRRASGQAILGHRVVCIRQDNKAWPVDPTDPSLSGITCGVTETSTTTPDQQIFIRFTGELTDPSFNWSEGPVWLGPDGTLTQQMPTSGHLVMVGIPLGPHSLQIDVKHIATLG